MTKPSVFIILLNWNGWLDTIECLESLQQLDYANYRLVVVDNGSTDDSCEQIESWASGKTPIQSPYIDYSRDNKPVYIVHYDKSKAESGGLAEQEQYLATLLPMQGLVCIQSGENRGFAGGCNVGMRYALGCGADYVWLLNNDTVVASSTLTKLVESAESDAQVGLVGSILRYYNHPQDMQAYGGGRIYWWLGATRHIKRNMRLDYITGASLLIKRSVMERVGLLDESYFFYWEDVDYSRRVVKSGYKLAVAEQSVVYHKHGKSAGNGVKKGRSETADCHMMGNMVQFFRRYAGGRWPVAVATQICLTVISRIWRRQARRIPPILRAAWAIHQNSREERSEGIG